MSFNEFVQTLPLLDHHAHYLIKGDVVNRSHRLLRVSSEADAQYPIADTANRLAWSAFQKVARQFDAATDAAYRAGTPAAEALKPMDASAYRQYNRRVFAAYNYRTLFIDTGFVPDDAILDLDQTADLTGLTVRPIYRLETHAEKFMERYDNFDEWSQHLLDAVSQVRAQGYVGCKSIAAYRVGLQVTTVREQDAHREFDLWRAHFEDTGSSRLEDQDIINYLLGMVAPALIEQHLPLQFHVGYGDADTDLYLGNPLLLRSFLQHFCYDGLQVVLLHCYPYHREAGYLASVFPGVYFDTSLVNNLAPSSTQSVVRESLELAPYSRYLFASDASTYVEMYAVAAQTFKDALAAQLDSVGTADTAQKQAWARMVCYDNAAQLYGVPLSTTN